MSVIIELKNYSWKYLHSQQPALDNINLQIEEGMFVGIIGPNGSGKTTLAYSMNGLIPGQYNGIKNGEVLVYGKEVEQYSHGELQKLAGMVFSDPEAQFTAMTVEDELVFGLENLGMSIPEIRERLEWVVDLTGLEKMLLKPPYELSGGQKQRVALAAVLAMTPKILILDEPTTMLDPVSRRRVFDVLAKLKKEQHNTIIVIEHNLENLIPLADRMILLSNSKLMLEDETGRFFQNMELLMREGINPPGALRFFHELQKAGYAKDALPVNLSEASRQLMQLFG
ncbi:Putative HMP/thiamine import ATP-binding protein YkoD [Anaerolineales bacterium]|nr:Putative HMP/thiamine import ATP-binding protein YkoD [Anaerolineales bacterium]